MTYYDGGFSGRAVTLRLEVNTQSQNVSSNSSVVSWALYAFKGSGVTAWNSDPSYWKVRIDGQEWLGSWTYNWGTQSQITLASGTKTVSHNADGTKSISVYADASDPTGYLGFASCGGTYTLATIPRASTPSFTNPMTAGTAYTINTNRASTSFTHTLQYFFGSASGTIATGVGASTSWTPPMELLNQIPNSVSGTGTIRCTTYSGSTVIGTKDVSLTLSAPASVVPSFTDCTHAEATVGVASNVGAYVQGISTLALAITGAAGSYGSTIKTYSITVAGQALSGQSVTSGPIASAGASVPIVATITDSRGRTASKTVNISVLAYAPPSITAITGQRALSSGVPNEDGTYVRVNVNAAVQSLMNSTERNALGYRVYTRLRGSTTWTLKGTTTPGGTSFNGYSLYSPYTVDEAWEFRVEVFDDFATSAYEFTVATSAIFQHWDGSDGIGIGKYREQGMLDVAGPIYQNNGQAVLDQTALPPGCVQMWAGSIATPSGWLVCDGSLVSRTTYAGLFAAIGTTYGAGDGSTTFALPNLKGRVPVGLDASQTEFDTMGETGGAKTHTLTVAEMPSHSHNVKSQSANYPAGDFADKGYMRSYQDNYTNNNATNVSSTGGGGAHNNLQPYLTLRFIIRT